MTTDVWLLFGLDEVRVLGIYTSLKLAQQAQDRYEPVWQYDGGDRELGQRYCLINKWQLDCDNFEMAAPPAPVILEPK